MGASDLEGDTIAAIATAPGVAALAVVRVSGPRAMEVLHRVAPSAGELRARVARRVSVRDPRDGAAIDDAVVVIHPGPRSYTGEDLVEISGHGGPLGPALILDACVSAGARVADPGEFTRRAYLNGRMDLIQAEAVDDLTGGSSPALRRAALAQLDRGLSERIAELREGLLGIEASLVHHLDFPTEDDPPVPAERIADQADAVAERVRRLIRTAPEGELLREGALVVLAGLPNSGKSSLFNALLGRERAIVTELPGTTRDALEATVSLGGFPFRLVDTAGLRETDDRIERMGVEVARRYLAAADLVLLCVEERSGLAPELADFLAAAAIPVVVVWSKADVSSDGDGGSPSGAAGAVSVSAHSGKGMDELRALLPRVAYRGIVGAESGAPVVTRARQRRALESALAEVEMFSRALRDGIGAEVASAHLRPAESALEEVLGLITRDEVLDEVFRNFCIGK